jgi:hypothetical protein
MSINLCLFRICQNMNIKCFLIADKRLKATPFFYRHYLVATFNYYTIFKNIFTVPKVSSITANKTDVTSSNYPPLLTRTYPKKQKNQKKKKSIPTNFCRY